MKIFLDDADYRKFFFVLSDVLDSYDVECWDFCVMPNHYHLILKNRVANLSRAMQHLNGEYAIWWNGRHQRVGHVFQGRFKDQIVQREGYLATLFRYVAMNPVRASLVSAPEAWPWSAYASTAGLASNHGFVSSELVLAEFGVAAIDVLRERYIRHVLTTRDDDGAIVQELRSRRRVVGDGAFKRVLLRETACVVDQPVSVPSYMGYL